MLNPQDTLFGAQARYEICGPLGQGGMGAVYLARAVDTDQFVAIKELAVPETEPPEVRERIRLSFDREAELLSTVRHPRIPAFIEKFEHNSGFYIVMQYIEGDELARLASNTVSEERALMWLTDIVGAVSACHDSDRVHGDIKPENIRVCVDDKHAYLVDFGVAIQDEASEKTRDKHGKDPLRNYRTPRYAAPEKDGAEAKITKRSDIYSLGATFYVLLTGQPPPNYVDRWQGIATTPIRLYNPAISPALEAVLLKCMELLPENRFANAAQLEAALASLSQPPKPVAADPPSLVTLPQVSRKWKLPWRRASRKELEAYLVPLPAPPQFVALSGDHLAFLAWQGGLVACYEIGLQEAHERKKKQRVLLQKGMCRSGLDDLRSISTYYDDERPGCLVFGSRGGRPAMTCIHYDCHQGLVGATPEELDKNVSDVGREGSRFFVWSVMTDQTLYPSSSVSGAANSASPGGRVRFSPHTMSKEAEPVSVDGCDAMRGWTRRASSDIYVIGKCTDAASYIWACHVPEGTWRRFEHVCGAALAITAGEDHLFVAHHNVTRQFLSTYDYERGKETTYDLLDMPDVSSLAVDRRQALWVATAKALYHLPFDWLLGHRAE